MRGGPILIPLIVAIIVIVLGIIIAFLKKVSLTFGIVISIFIVFMLQLLTRDSILPELAFNPAFFMEGKNLYTIITSMYLHGGFFHLLFNVVAILLIALPFEGKVGKARFGALYFVSGIIAVLFFAVTSSFNPAYILGASGAFNGILGAYARLYPREKVSFWLYFIPLPPLPMYFWAMFFLGLETLFVLVPGLGFTAVGNVAHAAHIGGLLSGFLLAPLVVRHREVKRLRAYEGLRSLAKTPYLKEILDRIRKEESAELRRLWLEDFVKKANCPKCGRELKISRWKVICRCGFWTKL